jgi:hypothetical protein
LFSHYFNETPETQGFQSAQTINAATWLYFFFMFASGKVTLLETLLTLDEFSQKPYGDQLIVAKKLGV